MHHPTHIRIHSTTKGETTMNKTERKEYNTKYYQENKDKFREYSKRYWEKTHPHAGSTITTKKQASKAIIKTLQKDGPQTARQIYDKLLPLAVSKYQLTYNRVIGRLRIHPQTTNNDGVWEYDGI